MNYSSVDKIKKIAKIIGWNGGKTEKDRKFLSDLKILTSNYNDMSYNDMKNVINVFKHNNASLLFLHIREPTEIQRVVNDFKAKTLLITNNNIKQIKSNMADANVLNYKYDYVIDNSGTLKELEQKAIKFISEVFKQNGNGT